jgi:hypothetical protein
MLKIVKNRGKFPEIPHNSVDLHRSVDFFPEVSRASFLAQNDRLCEFFKIIEKNYVVSVRLESYFRETGFLIFFCKKKFCENFFFLNFFKNCIY